jgi:hypothetical protein
MRSMLVMAMCVVLVLLGVAAVVKWGGLSIARSQLTARDGDAHDQWLALRTYAPIALVSGAGAGLLAAGAGGRIVMRVLAITSPDTAEGQLTEAEATIGDITFAGTLGLLGFTSLFLGVLTGVLYVLLCRWLPTGRLGGLIFGGLLLVLAGTRVEPLRAGNFDFNLVGPRWLAVLCFTGIILFHGMVVAAIAGRLSHARPLSTPWPASHTAGRRWSNAGQVALVVVVLIALPGFVRAILDILRLA